MDTARFSIDGIGVTNGSVHRSVARNDGIKRRTKFSPFEFKIASAKVTHVRSDEVRQRNFPAGEGVRQAL